MLKVVIPSTCIPEVKYSFFCLLKEFLGLEYELEIDPKESNFIIQIGEKRLIIKNHFFNSENLKERYHIDRIPKQVATKTIHLQNKSYPITSLFGQLEFQIKDQEIILEADLIAATFFMLTRWEEWVIKDKDHFDRFPSAVALAVKFNFLERPIVNEYVEVLWAFLQLLDIQQDRKESTYKVIPTHDVDRPYVWYSKVGVLVHFAKAFLKREFRNIQIHLPYFFRNKDPFDTHERLMNLAEKKGIRAHFFFMAGGNSKYDNLYQINHPKVLNLIQKIKQRGHHIGIHPSFNSYDNIDFFKKEKARLEDIVKQPIQTGRQHYLRFKLPDTWRLWNDCDMTWESTMTYADRVGFRCGVCYPFPVFDIVNREQLALYEKPTIVMETSFIIYEKLAPKAAAEKLDALKKEVKKYNGEFVFLWHNSSFNLVEYLPYEALVESLYD